MNLENLLNSANLTAEVTVAGLPPWRVAVRTDVEPGFFVRAFKPRIRVYSGNVLLEDIAPAGDPDTAFPTGSVLVLLTLLGAIGVVWLLVRK